MGSAAIRFPIAVGRLLRQRRQETGLTLLEASQRLASRGERIPTSTLGRIEQGKLDPGVRRLYLLLDLYQIPPHLVADLMELEGIADPPPAPRSPRDLERVHQRGLKQWEKGNIPGALACFFAVRQFVPSTAEDRLLRQRASLAFAAAARNLGKYRLARQIVDDLLCEPPDPAIALQVLTLTAALWRGLGSQDAALAFMRQAESYLDPGDRRQTAWILHQKAKLLVEAGRVADARGPLAEALVAYRAVHDAYGEVRALVLRVAILERSGEQQSALRCARSVVRLAERHGLERGVVYGRIEVGRLQAAAGQPAEGIDELELALAKAVRLEDRNAQFLAHYHLFKAHERRGDGERAGFELHAARHFLRFIDEKTPETEEVRRRAERD